jgi:TetR/AcrR family transcriptional repressor of nem operon
MIVEDHGEIEGMLRFRPVAEHDRHSTQHLHLAAAQVTLLIPHYRVPGIALHLSEKLVVLHQVGTARPLMLYAQEAAVTISLLQVRPVLRQDVRVYVYFKEFGHEVKIGGEWRNVNGLRKREKRENFLWNVCSIITILAEKNMARPHEFDRDAVLDRAMLLFWNKGYFNTSFPEIVAHLEINRSSIYNSFTDKRTLFIESLKHYISKESRSLVAALGNLPPNEESIRIILEQVAFPGPQNRNPKGCLVVNSSIEFASHDKEIKRIIEGNIKEVVHAFRLFIKAGQEKGTINDRMNAESLATALFHQITALRVTGKVITDKAFFKNAINSFIQTFR